MPTADPLNWSASHLHCFAFLGVHPQGCWVFFEVCPIPQRGGNAALPPESSRQLGKVWGNGEEGEVLWSLRGL